MSNKYNLTYTGNFKVVLNLTDFCKLINMHKFPCFILFLFILLGCQEQETGPVISTVYIEEIDMLRDSEAIVPKTEINKNIKIKEA